MFLVFNKDKLISCLISFSTVAILLSIAFFIRKQLDFVEVSNNEIDFNIYDNTYK